MLKDLLCALTFLVIAVAYYCRALDINRSSLADEIGAAGLPIIYSLLLSGIGLSLIGKTLVARRLLPVGTRPRINDLTGDGRRLMRAAGVLGMGFVYITIVGVAGYLLSVVLLIGSVTAYQGERFSRRLVGIAIGGGLAFWILFDGLLGVDMPPGFWPALWGG